MQKMSKLSIALLVLAVAVSLTSGVWANGYETVGGEISQTSFITVFLVPAIVTIGVFGAILLIGYIRTRTKTHSD